MFYDCVRESETIFSFDYNNVKTIYKTFWKYNEVSSDTYEKLNNTFGNIDIVGEHGIVKIYESATTMIGEHPLENGKVMGLVSIW